jgi:hypothetical protein
VKHEDHVQDIPDRKIKQNENEVIYLARFYSRNPRLEKILERAVSMDD